MNKSIIHIAIVIIIAVIATIIGYYIGTTQRGTTTTTIFSIKTITNIITYTTTVTSTVTQIQPSTTIPTISTPTVLEPYITITDFANRTIKIPRNISRIVAIGPGALRLVVYLNATDMVVGVEEVEKRSPVGRDYAMAVYNRFKDLPTIGPGGPGRAPDPERILAVKPDLVVMNIGYVQLYDPDKLQQEVRAPVVVVDYTPATSPDLSAFYRALRLLGTVLNRGERAEELINYAQSILNDLRQRVKGVDTSMVRVYVGAVSCRGAQPFTATQSPYPPLWWLSTKSIVDNATSTRGFINIDFEYLISMQPDIVFIDENNLNVVLQDFNRSSDKYCSLKAFRDGKVYGLLPYNYYHTNLVVALADAYYIGKVLYPDRFSDINPIEKANEIFMKFLGEPLYRKYIDGGYLGFTNLSDLFRCR